MAAEDTVELIEGGGGIGGGQGAFEMCPAEGVGSSRARAGAAEGAVP